MNYLDQPNDLAAIMALARSREEADHDCAAQRDRCGECLRKANRVAAEVPMLAAEIEDLRREVERLQAVHDAAQAAVDREREAIASMCDEQAALAKRDRCHAEAGTLRQIASSVRARRAAEAPNPDHGKGHVRCRCACFCPRPKPGVRAAEPKEPQ